MDDEIMIGNLEVSFEALRQNFLKELRELLSKTPHPDGRRVVEKYIQGIEENPWV